MKRRSLHLAASLVAFGGALAAAVGPQVRSGEMIVDASHLQQVLQAPIPFSALSVRWTAILAADSNITIRVRASADARNWTEWEEVSVDDHATPASPDDFFTNLLFFPPGSRFVEFGIELRGSPILRQLRFNFIDPGGTPAEMLDRALSQRFFPSLGPAFVTRSGWGCPEGQTAPQWPPQYTPVSHLIVHHTATGNNASDWPAVLRAIWQAHTFTNQWGDIGYNFLIDPNGVIYEGRAGGDNAIGAHFSCQNSNTMGVALLGTFGSVAPTAAALASLKSLLAWKAGQAGLDPLATALHPGTQLNLGTISGHRDAGASPRACSRTECPGDVLYGLLPSLRTDVNGLVASSAGGQNGIVGGAGFMPRLAAAGIVSIFGTNFAASSASAGTLPLPMTLAGATVRLNGREAPLFFVSPNQINFQIPWELQGRAQATVTVTAGNVTSNVVTVNLSPYAPELFSTNSSGKGQGIVVIADTGELAAPIGSIPGRGARPARRGEFLSIYATGLGAVTNPPASGAPALANPLSTTTEVPTVTIGGVPATVSFSGLAPGFVGLYQLNVQVPPNAPLANSVPVVLNIGGSRSNTVTIAGQ